MEQSLRLVETCKRLTRARSRAVSARVQDIPGFSALTASQIGILTYLEEQEQPVPQKQIQDFFHLTNPTVTGLLQRLEEKGMVVRKQSEQDARVRLVQLAPGFMGGKMSELQSSIQTLALKDMTQEELDSLEYLARKILRNLEGEEE